MRSKAQASHSLSLSLLRIRVGLKESYAGCNLLWVGNESKPTCEKLATPAVGHTEQVTLGPTLV
jgi:hypothetical protein